jgi:hypothetical protein
MMPTGENRSVQHWWNDTDRGEWSIGGMILTVENRSVERWWNDTDKVKQKCGALVE